MAKKILIVDDERDYPIILKRYIERGGYQIVTASNGSEAYRRLKTDEFDLMLLDFQMPDMKGNQFLSMIRADEKYKALPVIIVTAHREITQSLFLAYGASDVVYKPIDREDLLNKVGKYLG